MTVTSAGIVGGYIDPAYGANGEVKEASIPVLSLPLEISNAPEGTVCFAVYMDDPDAEPLCGYRWVHWMAVNIESGSIPEDFSRTAGSQAVQGKNDNSTTGLRRAHAARQGSYLCDHRLRTGCAARAFGLLFESGIR